MTDLGTGTLPNDTPQREATDAPPEVIRYLKELVDHGAIHEVEFVRGRVSCLKAAYQLLVIRANETKQLREELEHTKMLWKEANVECNDCSYRKESERQNLQLDTQLAALRSRCERLEKALRKAKDSFEWWGNWSNEGSPNTDSDIQMIDDALDDEGGEPNL